MKQKKTAKQSAQQKEQREILKTAFEQEDLMEQMGEQALKNWEKVIRSGLRLQEQSGQWWTNALSSASLAQDIQKRFTRFSTVASELIPNMQKQVGEALDLMGTNTQVANELFRKGLDAIEMPVVVQSQARWLEYWGACLGAMHANNEAIVKMSNRAMSTWIHVAQKNGETADAELKPA